MIIFLAGTSGIGKTTVTKELHKKNICLSYTYNKLKDPEKRMYYGLGSLLQAYGLYKNLDICYIADRAPIDYWVWSYYVHGLKPFPLHWEFMKETIRNTILVYKELTPTQIVEIAEMRGLDKWKIQKSQSIYKNLLSQRLPFLKKIILRNDEFLTIDDIKELLNDQ